MKTDVVRMVSLVPSWRCELIQDSNGNWFACCCEYEGVMDSRSYSTATYTTPEEAVQEALDRRND